MSQLVMKNFLIMLFMAGVFTYLPPLRGHASEVKSPTNDIVSVPKTIEPTKIAGSKPRNVVFILSDDHRYDAMSFMGH